MAFLQTLPNRKPVSQIDNYAHFYEFGDSGGSLILDTAGSQNLVNSTAPAAVQVTDAVQGEVASFPTASEGFTMPWIAGNVDKSFTMLINSNTIISTAIFFDTVASGSINIVSATKISTFTNAELLEFDIPAVTVDDWFHFGMSITSDFKYRLYKNGIESTTGELQGTETLILDSLSDFFDFQYIGFAGKLRIYDKVLSAADFLSIDKRDRKIA